MSAVAIIIPTHNRSDLLRETVASALAQTHADLQVIVVDDASSDDTPQVMAELCKADPRLQYHRFETSVGACKARNTGLAMTDAPFVNFLDSDDLMHRQKIAQQVWLLQEQRNADLVVCQMSHFNDVPGDLDILWNTFEGGSPSDRFLGHDPVWGMHAPLWRREALVKLGGLDETLPVAQDFDLHARALRMGLKAVLHSDLLCYCRRHTGPSIGGTKLVRRHETLMRVFANLAQLAELPNEAKKIMAGNYLWLANLATRDGAPKVFEEALTRAQEFGVPSGLLKTTRREAFFYRLTKRGRFFARMRAAALAEGYDLEARERWHFRHKVADEPNLRVPSDS